MEFIAGIVLLINLVVVVGVAITAIIMYLLRGWYMTAKEEREILTTAQININDLMQNIVIIQNNGLLSNISFSVLNQKISELKGLQSTIANELTKYF